MTIHDFSYVQPDVHYANLYSYNQDTTMSFLKYKKVPSSSFPILPSISTDMPTDILTHHTDKNYPTVKKAYGPIKQPTYYVGKCPSNQFVREFGSSSTTPSPVVESLSFDEESKMQQEAAQQNEKMQKAMKGFPAPPKSQQNESEDILNFNESIIKSGQKYKVICPEWGGKVECKNGAVTDSNKSVCNSVCSDPSDVLLSGMNS